MRRLLLFLCGFPFAVSALAQATAAGGTPASFRVTESGAAEYRIPIQVPPGIAGMEPKLALVYNSQAGNGLLGVGWNLEGLSAITRCPRTMAQDGVRGAINYDANDRYCLDGQRLMAISGTYGADGAEYRTERESFSKVISYGAAGNGPAWFKVWTKGGQILQYGNTADSRIEAQGKSTVRVWALNKASSATGNSLAVTYIEDNANGDYRPQRVDYAGGGSVQLGYEARPDAPPAYQAGSLIRTVVRLGSVKTYIGASLVKDYRLSYETGASTARSRLAAMAECDAQGACLPPLALQNQEGIETSLPWVFDWHSAGSWGPEWRILVADVNGDGRADLIATLPYGAGWETHTALSNGDGTYAPIVTHIHAAGGWSPEWKILAADVNGDGKTDLIATLTYSEGWVTHTAMSNGDGTYAPIVTRNHAPGSWGLDWKILAADVNGDGKADLIASYTAPEGFGWRTHTILSNGDGTFAPIVYHQQASGSWAPDWKILVADVNGDGKADLIASYTYSIGWETHTALGNGDGTYAPLQSKNHAPGSWALDWKIFAADVNGDGKADLIASYTYPDGFGWQTHTVLSKGDGTYAPQVFHWHSSGSWAADWNILTADVNGDGKADLIASYTYPDGFGWQTHAALSHGDGTYAPLAFQQLSSGSWSRDWKVFAADFNGDGKADLVASYTWPDGFGWQTHTSLRSGPFPDLLVSASDGSGVVWSAAHKPLTDPSVYVKDGNAVYPRMDLQAPMYVVSSASASNGTGGAQASVHAYGGLKLDQNGRGLLGFRWLEATQQATALKVRTELVQDWPYVGMPSLVKKTQSSGAVLSRTANLYSCLDPLGGLCSVAPGHRYLPFLSQSVETGNDLNGAALPAVTTAGQYDAFGNPIAITVSTEGHSRITTNTFLNSVTNWLLGRPTLSIVQSTAP